MKSPREHNRESINELKKKNPFIVPTNPHFFDTGKMEKFGYQTFDIVKENSKNYLRVERSIVFDNKKISVNPSLYEIHNDHSIGKWIKRINNKITSIIPFR